MSDTQQPPAEVVSTEVIYIGFREGRKGKAAVFARASDVTDELWFGGDVVKDMKGRAVGGVYTLGIGKRPDGGAAYYFGPRHFQFKRQWHDPGDIAGWQAQHESHAIRERMEKLEKATREHRPALEVMEPLRKAYKQTDYYGRLAIEALVLGYLRR